MSLKLFWFVLITVRLDWAPEFALSRERHHWAPSVHGLRAGGCPNVERAVFPDARGLGGARLLADQTRVDQARGDGHGHLPHDHYAPGLGTEVCPFGCDTIGLAVSMDSAPEASRMSTALSCRVRVTTVVRDISQNKLE